jgi:hypothetical protein
MRIYLAGPLFTEAERAWLETAANALEAAGIECFVPHRQRFAEMDPDVVYEADVAGVRGADAMVAWLDGPMTDDGTACEIGIFAELCRSDPQRYRGIVGIVTDWRVQRRGRAGSEDGGLNFFVHGAIRSCGETVGTIDEAMAVLHRWGQAS